ncbi:shikimate kinase [Actinopolymorpha alba]|uniref:shikimate kinase n=1 Tax=Actinopolymorpha alba TaxID=533267 RepID=UPI00037EF9A9|nr:shikimate kinase [Actinopolymorpha alba]
MAPWVVLVGPPGSGKTTVGGILAQRLGLGFRDTDADVEAEAGSAIADIFVEHGEPHFRALERAAVARALTEHNGILSLGGGSILDAQTRKDLCSHRVVFLDVSLADAARRVGLDTSRPLLLGNVRGQLKQLMDARRPLYGEVAMLIVSTDGREPEDVAAEIMRTIR